MAGIGNDLVREARRRAGLSQRQLAERAGTTQSAIARIETGRSTPSFDTVLRLVRLCGLDLDVMLVERDGSDWAQAVELLRLTSAERVADGIKTANVMLEISRKARNARGAA
jgi:transcriptional regulator with XRE-family HTH domain